MTDSRQSQVTLVLKPEFEKAEVEVEPAELLSQDIMKVSTLSRRIHGWSWQAVSMRFFLVIPNFL